MALIVRNQDGTYASRCALCGSPLTKPIYSMSHFIDDQAHDLYRFRDATMHWGCYVKWPDQAQFASMYFEAAVRRSEAKPWPEYWTVLFRSADMLVLYGFVVNEVSVVLRRSGTDIRIARDEWQHWLTSGWREQCRPRLECDAIAEVIPELARLTLPQHKHGHSITWGKFWEFQQFRLTKLPPQQHREIREYWIAGPMPGLAGPGDQAAPVIGNSGDWFVTAFGGTTTSVVLTAGFTALTGSITFTRADGTRYSNAIGIVGPSVGASITPFQFFEGFCGTGPAGESRPTDPAVKQIYPVYESIG